MAISWKSVRVVFELVELEEMVALELLSMKLEEPILEE